MKKRITFLIILMVAGSIYAWLATGKMRFVSALKICGNGAKEIALEQYYSGTVLQTARLSEEQFQSWINQMPADLGRLPYTFSMCWRPHHRIRFDGSAEKEVQICFTCDEIWTQATGRREIPENWRQPLRAMFLASDISDAAPDAKDKLRFTEGMIDNGTQDGAGQPAARLESKSEGSENLNLNLRGSPGSR